MKSSTHPRGTVTNSLGLTTTVEFPPRPPLPLSPPSLASVRVHLTTLAETQTRAIQAPAALATDKPTSVRHIPCVHRQHCRGKIHLFHRCSCYRLVDPAPTSLDSCLARWVPPSTSSRISDRFAWSPRAPSPPVPTFQGAMPTTGPCASSTAPLS